LSFHWAALCVERGKFMKIKTSLIMFDFDGTLADTKEDIAASANYLLGQKGMAAKSIEEIASYVGDGLPALLRRLLRAEDDEVIADAIEIFRGHYFDHCLDKTKAYPGVEETLNRFSNRTLAVVTNKPKNFTDKILDGLGLTHHFVTVVGGDSAYARKPSPEAFLAVLEALMIPAGRALVVGDSPNDVNGGRAAGCATCAVTYGLSTRESLEAASPDFLVDAFPQLLDVIE
jgi:phosphoglycolate phosphatase